MKIIAPRNTKKVTAFFRKLNWVWSTLSLLEESLINLLIMTLRILEMTSATSSVATMMMEYFIVGLAKNVYMYERFRFLQFTNY